MLDGDLHELRTAEEFLDYFGIDFDPGVVAVNRLRILKRFHDAIVVQTLPPDDDVRRVVYALLLGRAYHDAKENRPVPSGSTGEERGTASTTFIPLSDVRM